MVENQEEGEGPTSRTNGSDLILNYKVSSESSPLNIKTDRIEVIDQEKSSDHLSLDSILNLLPILLQL